MLSLSLAPGMGTGRTGIFANPRRRGGLEGAPAISIGGGSQHLAGAGYGYQLTGVELSLELGDEVYYS